MVSDEWCAVCVCGECGSNAPQISGLHVEVLGTSTSDYRANIGSRKLEAIILRNFGVRIACQNKVRNVCLALQCQIGTDVPDFALLIEIGDFILEINTDPEISQDDSHMFPRPNVCPIIGC